MGHLKSDRPRILHLLPSLDYGGNETLRLVLGEKIAAVPPAERSIELRFCALGRGGVVATELARMGLRVDALGLRPHPLDVETAVRFAWWLRQQRIDLVHTAALEANTHGAFAMGFARARALVTEETGVARTRPGWARLVSSVAHRRASRVVAQSEAVKRYLVDVEGVPPAKIAVIYNCARVGPRGDRMEVRRELGVPDGGPLIASVGRLAHEKGHDILLRAFVRVRAAAPGTRLAIVGDGPAALELRRLAVGLSLDDAVAFLGARRDVSRVVGAADLFVLPSRTEGLPVALVEAMLLGVPAVASAVDGVREVMTDGESGVLTPPDAEPLADAMLRLLRDRALAQRLAERGAAEARRRFGVSRYVTELLDLYERCLAPS